MHYFQQIIFKFLIIILTVHSTSSYSQSIKELVTGTIKTKLHLGAKLDDLKHEKNNWALETDPFYPFIVYQRYTGNHPWEEKEFDVSKIGFLVNDSNKVDNIFLPIPYSFDALTYLGKKYGDITMKIGIDLNDLDPNPSVMSKVWNMGKYVVVLYDDPIRRIKIVAVGSTSATTIK